ncbi:fatty-acyl-CoA synthase/long-chain acyl-CoA synthetase [Tamaricihabitans halophyticus]|uniref:Fatty-acyl-CoA synthase/long-chain acyl-CoA synthetase n=2 Tax=Tamaricihabitans halophyticus TaxID=1262583 RepID=A0A4R2R430_9PSEU|nr:fatty-acyl-CoA synthase/long-chain acyl-CoA synthetase [Tamaricihabitans halophyticus]
MFDGVLARHGAREAVVVDGVRWSYHTLADQVDVLANALARRGVRPGVLVALAMSNRIEYVLADLALIRCGAGKVPLNDQLAAREIDYILRDSGAAVAIADAGMLPAVRASAAPALHMVITVDESAEHAEADSWQRMLAEPSDRAVEHAAAAPEDIGLILYTGGTTGNQKGVVHTQRTLANNMLAHLVETGMRETERVLLTSPLPHSAGFLAQTALLRGATVFLERRFDTDLVLRRIAEDRVTFTFLVPTMIYRLLDRAEGRNVDLSALRTLLYGAAPITLDRLEQGLRRFGQVFMQLYGQSEAPNFLTRLRKDDHDPERPERLTSCGQPVLLAEVEVHDDAGNRLPAGEPGEIVARAPYVMSGYFNLPDKTAETLRGGWLHTGDIGRMDSEGYVYLLDRVNDVIITGGMNVYTTEVENVLAEYPGIEQVAVVGVPHPDWGEAVVAFAVPTGQELDEAAIQQHCRAQLAAYKRPKAISRLPAMPTTAYGKTDKKALRQSWPGW